MCALLYIIVYILHNNFIITHDPRKSVDKKYQY